MDHSSLLQNSRWELLKNISTGEHSPKSLAQETGISLPNISQQLKLLEAYGFVEYSKAKTGKKPQHLYKLKKDFCHITFARQGFAEMRFWHPDGYDAFLVNSLFLTRTEDRPYLNKLLLMHEEIMENCSVAFLKSSPSEIEVVFLTENVESIRKKYSNTFIKVNEKERKVIAWTHSIDEMNEGLARKEAYFENLLKHHVLYDPKGRFEKVKR